MNFAFFALLLRRHVIALSMEAEKQDESDRCGSKDDPRDRPG
jgi:hypothetical protein